MCEFVAEQYLSRTDATAAERGASVARVAAEQLTLEGTPIEFVRSIFIPQDETCFYLYRADSIETVRKVAARASMRFERVSEAVTETGRPRGRGGLSNEKTDAVVRSVRDRPERCGDRILASARNVAAS